MTVCDSCMNQLRDKWKQWNECLNGDDVNSISNQLVRMTWDITAFRVLIEAHQLASQGNENTNHLKAFPFRLLDKCFSESLLLSFRRLMDKEGLDGKRGVYSLRSLLDDMSRHSHLLTREALIQVGNEELSTEEPQNPEFVRDMEESRHKTIDRTIGVDHQNRSPNDQILAKTFDDECAKLDKHFQSVEQLINKLIAHAATLTSREGANEGNDIAKSEPPSLDELYSFHELLCKTTHFVQTLISNTLDLSFLPTLSPRSEEYETLARPLISNGDIPRLDEQWQEMASRYESWSKERTI